MTSDRSYPKALPQEIAVMDLRRSAGTQLDPAIVRAFIDAVGGVWAAATAPAFRTAAAPAASTPIALQPQPVPQVPCS